MLQNLKLEVIAILGDSVNGRSQVKVNLPYFDAIRQSIWAKHNARKTGTDVKPELPFTPRLIAGTGLYHNEFMINGVEVNVFSNKEQGTLMFMDSEIAKKLLVKESTFDITQFNLGIALPVVA